MTDEGRLWFGLTAAPAAWTVAELAGYLVASRDCNRWATGLAAYAVPNAPAVVVGLSLVMALLAAAGLTVALKSLRAVEQPAAHAPAPARTRQRFMSLGGLIVSGLLLANIVLFGLSPFLVNPCSEAR